MPFYEATELEERTDLNQIYDLAGRIKGASYIHEDEVEGFAEKFFEGNLSTQDRITLEGLVREALGRFELDEDDYSNRSSGANKCEDSDTCPVLSSSEPGGEDDAERGNGSEYATR